MCSLEEAYGSDFANQLNQLHQKKEDSVPVEEYEYIDDDTETNQSPKDFLYKSLDTPTKIVVHSNPDGHLQNSSNYSLLEQSACKDYFFHIDTCTSCQRRLQKRIVSYLESKKIDIQNGASGVQVVKNLFEDPEESKQSSSINDNLTKRKWNLSVKEGFENPLPNCLQTRPFYILLFGLFVIFVLDKISSK